MDGTLSGMVRSEPAWYVRTASGADFERYATMAPRGTNERYH